MLSVSSTGAGRLGADGVNDHELHYDRSAQRTRRDQERRDVHALLPHRLAWHGRAFETQSAIEAGTAVRGEVLKSQQANECGDVEC